MRLFLVIVVMLVASLVLFGVCARPIANFADSRLNAVTTRTRTHASAAAIDLHSRLYVADLHCDATIWDRSLLSRSRRGHADLPRLRAGGVALQVFSFPNAYPLFANYRRTLPWPDIMGVAALVHRWPRFTWTSPLSRALFQADILHDAVRESEGGLVMVTSIRRLAALGVDRSLPDAPVGAILAIEGLHLRDLTSIDYLFLSGVRVFGIAHMSDNSVGGSAHGWRKHGLSDFGRRVVAHIDSLGGIIDLAHASDATIDDVLATTVPVLVSHTGVDGTCPGPRNLSDHQLARIAARDGVIGIGFWRGATCGEDATAIARAVRHAVRVAGIDAIALGSDFDGAVQTPFDAAGLVYLTEALLAEGFDAHDVARIMGLNVMEFFMRSLPPE